MWFLKNVVMEGSILDHSLEAEVNFMAHSTKVRR